MISTEVPKALCIGNLLTNKRISKIFVPPPAPINPVMKPLPPARITDKAMRHNGDLLSDRSKGSTGDLSRLIPVIQIIKARTISTKANPESRPLSGILSEKRAPICAIATEDMATNAADLRAIF